MSKYKQKISKKRRGWDLNPRGPERPQAVWCLQSYLQACSIPG
jgi:hypothetical protein